MKTCKKCGESFPASEFYSGDNACRPCRCARVRANRASRRDQYAAYERERFRDPTRRQKVAEYVRRRRERHPDKTEAA